MQRDAADPRWAPSLATAALALVLGWCGTTLQDASVYIADAPYQRLQLLKESSIHDWAYVLGAEQFYALDKAAIIATCVKDVGLAFLVAGVCICLAPAVRRQRARDLLAAEPLG
jgi:hypothetical protein